MVLRSRRPRAFQEPEEIAKIACRTSNDVDVVKDFINKHIGRYLLHISVSII